MGAPSPAHPATDLAAYAITVGGQPLDPSYQLLSIDVWLTLDRLPRAQLVLIDGSPSDGTFPISESPDLIPGVALDISLGYGEALTRVFSGVVRGQELRISQTGFSRLVVEVTDPAMAMTLARGNAVFRDLTDSDLCTQLIRAAGLTPQVAATTTVHETIVQYYASAWDLMVMRAQLNGMGVMADGGVITVAAPDTAAPPVLTLTYGESILELEAEMDAATQVAADAIASRSWNPAIQAVVSGGAATSSLTTPGNLSSASLAAVFGAKPLLQTGAALDAAELTDWSSAELQRRQLSKIRGQVRFQGSALAHVGCMVELAGLGDRFNGSAFVSAVHHRVADGQWTTGVDVGRAAEWFAAVAPRIAAPGAAGQLPPASGVQSGIVLQTDQDPDGEFRILVSVPILDAGQTGVWARYGGPCPAVGQEVALAFFNGDPRCPVVLGALWSRAHPPM